MVGTYHFFFGYSLSFLSDDADAYSFGFIL